MKTSIKRRFGGCAEFLPGAVVACVIGLAVGFGAPAVLGLDEAQAALAERDWALLLERGATCHSLRRLSRCQRR